MMKRWSSFTHEEVRGFKFGSHPVNEPRLYSFIYYIDGLLIDTGHARMSREVLSQVGELEVNQMFITHHHEDHTGNLELLQEHFDGPCYASADCVNIMKAPPPISPAQWMIWGNYKPNHQLKTCSESSIATNKYELQLIPSPGHAPDMVCLYLAEKGWLFSADLWVSEYIRYFMRTESMKTQIESIKRILTFDFEVLFCSHNPQFRQGQDKVRAKLQFLEDFYGQAAELYHKGYSATKILSAMKLKERWSLRFLSLGALSTINMIRSVIRDESDSSDRDHSI